MLALLLALDTARTTPVAEPPGPAPARLAGLDTAVSAVDGARAAVLAAPRAISAAATAVDATDAACATGDVELAAQAAAAARPAVAQVQPALAALPDQVDAYRAALAQLAAAAAPLPPAQRAPLEAAVAAGEREGTAHRALAEVARTAWPAFAELGGVQATWLDRAAAGWYRDRAEAAGAYTVLREPVLAAVERARAGLAQADTARQEATQSMRSALGQADAALGPLRSAPPG